LQDKTLDLNALLVSHPVATFFVRVVGESMHEARIFPGDILIVDRSLEAANKTIVVALIDGEFRVKHLVKEEKRTFLASENPSCSMLEITQEGDFQVWGVVTYVIHSTKTQ
jgi:DNA polymerase V